MVPRRVPPWRPFRAFCGRKSANSRTHIWASAHIHLTQLRTDFLSARSLVVVRRIQQHHAVQRAQILMGKRMLNIWPS